MLVKLEAVSFQARFCRKWFYRDTYKDGLGLGACGGQALVLLLAEAVAHTG